MLIFFGLGYYILDSNTINFFRYKAYRTFDICDISAKHGSQLGALNSYSTESTRRGSNNRLNYSNSLRINVKIYYNLTIVERRVVVESCFSKGDVAIISSILPTILKLLKFKFRRFSASFLVEEEHILAYKKYYIRQRFSASSV